MTGPRMALMTVVSVGAPPSLAEAAVSLGVETQDLNAAFGVVPIDKDRGLYAVEVRADRLPQSTTAEEAYRGPFSSPRIAPFGPPSTRRKSSD